MPRSGRPARAKKTHNNNKGAASRLTCSSRPNDLIKAAEVGRLDLRRAEWARLLVVDERTRARGARDAVAARVEADGHARVHAHDALGSALELVQIVRPRPAPKAAARPRGGLEVGGGQLRGELSTEALLVAELAAVEAEVRPAAALSAHEGALLVHVAALATPLAADVLHGLRLSGGAHAEAIGARRGAG